MKFTAVFDAGRPYEEDYYSIEELGKALKEFYLDNKDNDYPFDCKVYDEEGNDLTDTYIIETMVADIMEVEDGQDDKDKV
jgi:hypothetical protein